MLDRSSFKYWPGLAGCKWLAVRSCRSWRLKHDLGAVSKPILLGDSMASLSKSFAFASTPRQTYLPHQTNQSSTSWICHQKGYRHSTKCCCLNFHHHFLLIPKFLLMKSLHPGHSLVAICGGKSKCTNTTQPGPIWRRVFFCAVEACCCYEDSTKPATNQP